MKFASTLRNYDKKNFPKDLVAGVIIAAVSIPISMGYAQISGLPAVYGLFGSVFPILVFALFTTSPQFIFGVDAAPAALVGTALVQIGIVGGSDQAIAVVPVITFCVSVWLLAFHLIKAGKLVNFISLPVMGGFVSGICVTIIMMQIPKLLGGTAGVGEVIELIEHIGETLGHVNLPSVIMGVLSLAIMIIFKKIMKKLPMAVILMAAGAIMTACLPVREWGIQTLAAVEPGLPAWRLPDFSAISVFDVLVESLSIAVVIMAETLLSENNFAQKNGYKVNSNQELLAFSLGNFAAAFTGCCPMNGSVSRTAMSEQYQGKTQMTGIVAGVAMILVLLFGTGFIGYLPVPVLTAIVISALMGATEFHIAQKLWKLSKKEFVIFVAAFVGVLLLGTIKGVIIGVILSFAEVIIRSSKPATSFVGVKPGYNDFNEIDQSGRVRQIEGVIIYKFSGGLFFANIEVLQNEIEEKLTPDIRAVIIDASGIGSIDMTAAERLEALYESLKAKGIRLYLTEHIAALNNQLRALGLGYMIEEGAVRMSIEVALMDLGLKPPYPLEGVENSRHVSELRKKVADKAQEFSWAFGDESHTYIEKQIHLQIEHLKKSKNVEALLHGRWNYKSELDMDEWLEHLEEHIKEIVRISGENEETLAERIENHRHIIREKIKAEHPELAERFAERRHILDKNLKESRPEVYELVLKIRNKKQEYMSKDAEAKED